MDWETLRIAPLFTKALFPACYITQLIKQAEERFKAHTTAPSSVRGSNRYFLRRHALRPLQGHHDQATWLPQPLWFTTAIQQSRRGGQGQQQEQGRSGSTTSYNLGKRPADTAVGGPRNKNKRTRNRGSDSYGSGYGGGGGYNKANDRDQPFRDQGSQGDNRGNRNPNPGSWNPPKNNNQGNQNKAGRSRNRGNAQQNQRHDDGGRRGGGGKFRD